MRQALFSRGFQQPQLQLSVNFDGTSDHAVGGIVNSTFVLIVSFVVSLTASRL